MPFWRSETLHLKLAAIINPFNPDRIAQGSYELSLGPEVYLSGEREKRILDTPGDQVIIPPGQFALLITEERICVPRDALGLISLKSKAKFPGLINVSGFHVDPGFEGRLIFSVYNAGAREYVAARGDALFLIWFAALDGPTTDLYKGRHFGQDTITSTYIQEVLGHTPSPSELARRIDRLEDARRMLTAILIALVAGIILLLLGEVLPNRFFPADSPLASHISGLPTDSPSPDRSVGAPKIRTFKGAIATTLVPTTPSVLRSDSRHPTLPSLNINRVTALTHSSAHQLEFS